jgi:hypothetical protein
MKCRNCGTEIADKALICYRCGEATAAPKVAPPAPPPVRGPIPVIIAMLVLAAVAVLVIPELETATQRSAGWVTIVIVAVLTAWKLRPRSRRRLR